MSAGRALLTTALGALWGVSFGSQPAVMVCGDVETAQPIELVDAVRRVIDFFLSPVVKYLDEGMKVR